MSCVIVNTVITRELGLLTTMSTTSAIDLERGVQAGNPFQSRIRDACDIGVDTVDITMSEKTLFSDARHSSTVVGSDAAGLVEFLTRASPLIDSALMENLVLLTPAEEPENRKKHCAFGVEHDLGGEGKFVGVCGPKDALLIAREVALELHLYGFEQKLVSSIGIYSEICVFLGGSELTWFALRSGSVHAVNTACVSSSPRETLCHNELGSAIHQGIFITGCRLGRAHAAFVSEDGVVSVWHAAPGARMETPTLLSVWSSCSPRIKGAVLVPMSMTSEVDKNDSKQFRLHFTSDDLLSWSIDVPKDEPPSTGLKRTLQWGRDAERALAGLCSFNQDTVNLVEKTASALKVKTVRLDVVIHLISSGQIKVPVREPRVEDLTVGLSASTNVTRILREREMSLFETSNSSYYFKVRLDCVAREVSGLKGKAVALRQLNSRRDVVPLIVCLDESTHTLVIYALDSTSFRSQTVWEVKDFTSLLFLETDAFCDVALACQQGCGRIKYFQLSYESS